MNRAHIIRRMGTDVEVKPNDTHLRLIAPIKINLQYELWIAECPNCEHEAVTSSISSTVICNSCQTQFAIEVE